MGLANGKRKREATILTFLYYKEAPVHSSIASEEYGEGDLHASTDKTLGTFSLMSTHVQQNELIAFLMYNTIILYKKKLNWHRIH